MPGETLMGHLRLHSGFLRLGAENPDMRFTDGVSSYSDFRAISDIYRCEEGKRFKIVRSACNLCNAESKTVNGQEEWSVPGRAAQLDSRSEFSCYCRITRQARHLELLTEN